MNVGENLFKNPQAARGADEYYPEVFGGGITETCDFGGLDKANEILGLMMRHWNTVAATASLTLARLPTEWQNSQPCEL